MRVVVARSCGVMSRVGVTRILQVGAGHRPVVGRGGRLANCVTLDALAFLTLTAVEAGRVSTGPFTGIPLQEHCGAIVWPTD
jgi:hypothetical protein